MSVIYFIQSGGDGPIKIGRASNLAKRVAELQCGNPSPLVILASIHGGYDVETRFHRHLSAHRLRGEWFEPSPLVFAAIELARNGILPATDTLPRCAQAYIRLTPLERAVEIAGGQSAFARLVGVKQPSVWAWLNHKKPLPAEYVLGVEAATGVSRHDLRPDIYPIVQAA